MWYNLKALWHWKGICFRKIQQTWRISLSFFYRKDQPKENIHKAGNEALGVLYASKHGSNLDLERTSKFSEKVSSSSQYLPPERLPPTKDAAKCHSERVYLQVQTWLGNSMTATEWGWNVCALGDSEKVLKPCRMDKDAAPKSLLKVIKCNCTGQCDRNTCSCRKNGLQCTLACGQCKGIACTNSQRNAADMWRLSENHIFLS